MNCPTTPTVSILKEKETDSTNNRLAQLCDRENIKEFTTLLVDKQTAGKGQRGNSWESAPGMNLTFSTVLYPSALKAREQSSLSMLIALSVYDTLSTYAEGFSIKWPNDIYWKDKKICGILIENELEGAYLLRCIAGIRRKYQPRAFCLPCPQPCFTETNTGTRNRQTGSAGKYPEKIVFLLYSINFPKAEYQRNYSFRLSERTIPP